MFFLIEGLTFNYVLRKLILESVRFLETLVLTLKTYYPWMTWSSNILVSRLMRLLNLWRCVTLSAMACWKMRWIVSYPWTLDSLLCGLCNSICILCILLQILINVNVVIMSPNRDSMKLLTNLHLELDLCGTDSWCLVKLRLTYGCRFFIAI